MKPVQRLGGVLCAFLLLLCAGPYTGAAAQGDSPDEPGNPRQDTDIGFYIRAQLPENQLSDVPYFDLRMEPGQGETLEVLVGNKRDTPLRVRVRAVCATTNRNGIIDYKNDPRHDDTLPCRFCEISTVQQPVLEIPGGGTAMARVDVQMPNEGYEGSLLGSVLVEKIPDEEWADNASSASSDADSPTLQLQNRFYYAVAARLWQGDAVPAPDFSLNEEAAAQVEGRPTVVYTVQNPVTNTAVQMEGDFTVYRSGEEEPVARALNAPLEMANNSTMEYGVLPADGRLPEGQYTTIVQLRHGGVSWDFTADFAVTAEQAREINVIEEPQPERYVPAGLIVALVLIGAAAVTFAVAAVYFYKKRAGKAGKYRPHHAAERLRRRR